MRVDSVWVVIPTYNEAGTVVPLVEAVRSVTGADPDAQWRILIVDDASPDGTGELADAMAAADPRISVLHRPGKHGLGAAYLHGMRVALERGADAVLEFDADGSHPADAVPRMLAALRAGADLAIGSRWVPGGGIVDWPWHRQAISRAGNVYARVMLGSPVRDMTAGCRAFRASLLRSIPLDQVHSQGYCFQIDMTRRAHLAGATIVEVPIVFRERELGVSKMSLRIAAEALWRIPRLREQPAAPAAVPVHAA